MDTFKYSLTRLKESPSLVFSSYWWKDLKYDISALFNPRQKWLTKKIPNRWIDKDGLIEICLFEILVNYVEEEASDGSVSNLDYDWNKEVGEHFSQEFADSYIERNKKIKKVYTYIKKTRPALVKKMDEAYPEMHDLSRLTKYTKEMYERDYGEVNRLEKLIDKKDQCAMIEIVKLRHYLWT